MEVNGRKLTMRPTDDYDRLVAFFIENGLEFSEEDEEDEVPEDIVKLYEVTDEDGRLIGGVCLAYRQNEYIIDGIAVEPEFRKSKIGLEMLNKALDDAASLGAENVYLVAKAPGFFRKRGFVTISAEDAPEFYECRTCPQFNKNCFPEIMKLKLE